MADRPQDSQSDEGAKTPTPTPHFDREAERSARAAVSTDAPAHAWKRRARVRVLLIALLAFAGIGALVWYLSTRYWATPATPITLPAPGQVESIPASTPTPTATAAPTETATPDASPGASATPTPTPVVALPAPPTPESSSSNSPGRLLVPVVGITPEQLRDTFTESRSEGRAHNAIDIIAPRGTPVVAAADGRVIKLFQSEPGGITIYQLDPDNRTVYYYSHLERYADGLAEGHFARRGETIAYVGDTGNAGPGNYHLHFSVSTVADPKRWWEGENVNPYPLLTGKN